MVVGADIKEAALSGGTRGRLLREIGQNVNRRSSGMQHRWRLARSHLLAEMQDRGARACRMGVQQFLETRREAPIEQDNVWCDAGRHAQAPLQAMSDVHRTA